MKLEMDMDYTLRFVMHGDGDIYIFFDTLIKLIHDMVGLNNFSS